MMVTLDAWRSLTPIFDTQLSSDQLVAQGEVFAIVEAPVTSSHLDPPHWHDTYEIGYILQGNGIMVMGQRVYAYEAGQVYVINDLEPHRTYSGEQETRMFVVHFHPSLLESGWIGQMHREARAPFLPQFGQHGPLIPLDNPLTVPVRTLLLALREEARQRKPLWDVIASAQLLQAIGLLARQAIEVVEYSPKELQRRQALKRIKPILQLLQARYVEALSLDELASAGSW